MKVKNIITLACNFIGETEIADLIENQTEENVDEKVDEMVELFNIVRNEVVCEYMPSLENEEFEVKDFKLYYSSFKRKPLKIYSVEDKLTRRLKFRSFPEYLMVKAGKVNVTYSYQPKGVNLDDEIEESVPERVYAYGVAREYLMREGMFEDAEIFETRFKNSLKVLTQKSAVTVLAGRRWV